MLEAASQKTLQHPEVMEKTTEIKRNGFGSRQKLNWERQQTTYFTQSWKVPGTIEQQLFNEPLLFNELSQNTDYQTNFTSVAVSVCNGDWMAVNNSHCLTGNSMADLAMSITSLKEPQTIQCHNWMLLQMKSFTRICIQIKLDRYSFISMQLTAFHFCYQTLSISSITSFSTTIKSSFKK